MSLSGDSCAENDVAVDESPWWITSHVERGIRSRLTRSVAACERWESCDRHGKVFTTSQILVVDDDFLTLLERPKDVKIQRLVIPQSWNARRKRVQL